MSLKPKLKRAFYKAHKFIIVFTVIVVIISSTCLTAFAEEKYLNAAFPVFSGTQIYIENNSVVTEDYSTSNTALTSPYGGRFYASFLDHPFSDSSVELSSVYGHFWDVVSSPSSDNRKVLFNFKANQKYKISCYFVLPWEVLFSNYGTDFNLTKLEMVLNERGTDRVAFDCTSAANSSSWVKRTLTSSSDPNINTNNVLGFYKAELEFVPNINWQFTSVYFRFNFNLADLPAPFGDFGISDFVIAYNSDPLTEPNYSAPDGSAIDDHNNLANNLEDSTSAYRDEASSLFSFDSSDTTMNSLFTGVLAWTKVINSFLGKNPWYNRVLQFSLSLGIFGFLFGLAIYSVGSFARGDRIRKSEYRRNNSVGMGVHSRKK